MRHISRCLISLAVRAGSLSAGFGYTKPAVYDKDHNSIILQNQYLYFPHSWIIVKAIDRLEKDGFPEEVALARHHLLPMIEGVTFNDVWGDADLAGASVLDYYVPDSPNEDFGSGSAFLSYHNPTWTYADLAFYGYGNAAEYSQFKYDYAKRIYLGQWGTDFHDLTAGWVVDDLIGQADPQSGDWFEWSLPIDPNGSLNPHHTNFGNNRTPADIMADMALNFRHGLVFDPNQADPDDSILNLPSKDVFDHQEDWLEDHYGSADQVKAYNGFDGQGYAVYANWTYDAGGVSGTTAADACWRPRRAR